MSTTLMMSQQLCLPAHDLFKIKLIKIPAQRKEMISPTPYWGAIDSVQLVKEGGSVLSIGRFPMLQKVTHIRGHMGNTK